MTIFSTLTIFFIATIIPTIAIFHTSNFNSFWVADLGVNDRRSLSERLHNNFFKWGWVRFKGAKSSLFARRAGPQSRITTLTYFMIDFIYWVKNGYSQDDSSTDFAHSWRGSVTRTKVLVQRYWSTINTAMCLVLSPQSARAAFTNCLQFFLPPHRSRILE